MYSECIDITITRLQTLIEDSERADVEVKFGTQRVMQRSIDLIKEFSSAVLQVQVAQQTLLLECGVYQLED